MNVNEQSSLSIFIWIFFFSYSQGLWHMFLCVCVCVEHMDNGETFDKKKSRLSTYLYITCIIENQFMKHIICDTDESIFYYCEHIESIESRNFWRNSIF